MNPFVRKATKNDLPVLETFMDGLVDAERPMDVTIKDGKVVYYDLEYFITNDDAILLVAELEGEIVSRYLMILRFAVTINSLAC